MSIALSQNLAARKAAHTYLALALAGRALR